MKKNHTFRLNRPLELVLLGCILSGMSGCEKNLEAAPSQRAQMQAQLLASGGVAQHQTLCPRSVLDTLVPITQLHPAPLANQPKMTVAGLKRFIQQKNITRLDDLLGYFPDEYRTNFSLVEHTRATGQSNLNYPRIILFGADGHFLLNIGTKPDDPKYHFLDVAQLHEDTGHWEFSVFDFNGEKPQVIRNDPSCAECHGTANARPVWGTNLDWPGVFGDNIAPGPQGEALDGKHAEKMNALMRGELNSPRFGFLLWSPQPLTRGAKRRIAHHAFGAELILSNIAMGSATARGAFVRLQNTMPSAYREARAKLLLAYYRQRGNNTFNPLATEGDIYTQLNTLGLDVNEAFSLATLAAKETPRLDWSMGEGDLLDMLMLQVLNDLRLSDKNLAQLLAQSPAEKGLVDCPDTLKNMAELIDFKMLHLFYLRGSARYQVNWVYYPLDAEDIYERVFEPLTESLTNYLSAKK